MSTEDDHVPIDPPRLSDESQGPFAALVRAGRSYRPPFGLRKTRPLADSRPTSSVNAEGAARVNAAESEARPRDPEQARSSNPPSSSSGGR